MRHQSTDRMQATEAYDVPMQKLRVTRTGNTVDGHPYLRLLRAYLEEFLPREHAQGASPTQGAGAAPADAGQGVGSQQLQRSHCERSTIAGHPEWELCMCSRAWAAGIRNTQADVAQGSPEHTSP